MLKIYNLKDKGRYLKEVAILEHNEWSKHKNLSSEEYDKKINNKMDNIMENYENKYFCKLILLDDTSLVGFISIFPEDCNLKKNLTPWYATMYVKKKYRGYGYSKLLNDAIIKEAKKRGIKKLYLKTTLNDYYEKFGAVFMENIGGEKLYYIDIK